MPQGWPFPYFRPFAAVLFDRYNVDEPSKKVDESVYVQGVNYGPAPMLIPRLWNMSLGARAGLDQYGFPGVNFNTFPLPPMPIYPTRRPDLRSISLGWNAYSNGATNDATYIPATFVGWSLNNSGLGR